MLNQQKSAQKRVARGLSKKEKKEKRYSSTPFHVRHFAFPASFIPLYSPRSSVGLDVVIGVAIEPASEMPVEQNASIDVRHLRELVSVSPCSARPGTGH